MKKQTNIYLSEKCSEESLFTKKYDPSQDDSMLYFLHHFPFGKWRIFLWNTFLLALTIVAIIVLFDLTSLFLEVLRSIAFKTARV